ncbi:GNAT family N-acetyltransferase [Streptomyces sp. NPDC050448]|uniref:GNAT family N-acetyltransferase n=1 Tax=Streptomyces sp. NPDC050448 TaxID=3155404 RepID=UPI0034457BE5
MSAEPLRVEILDRLDENDRRAWDQLAAPKSFYAGTRWLEFQREQEQGGRVHHVCVRSGDRLVGAVAVFVVDRPSSGNYHPGKLFPDAADQGDRPVTLVGSSRGFYSGPLLSDDRALEPLLDAVQDIADTHSDGLAWWLYATSADAALLARRSGVTPRLLNGECVIPLPGSGFEDYLEGLLSSRRKRIRRDLREFESAGLRLSRARLSDEYQRCGALLAATQQKYGVQASADAMTLWLEQLSRAARDTGRLHLCMNAEEQPIGFSLIFTEGQTAYTRAIGFDYERAPHVGEYFQLSCYQPIRDAYADGATALHLGAGAYQAKARRGAVVHPMWAVPTRPGAWDATATKAYNTGQAEALRAELPGEDLVWTHDSEGWL